MLEDKQRWNEKYLNFPMPTRVAPIVATYASEAKVGRGLDIACGTGRHTRYLASLGFDVDAVDFSDYALEQIEEDPKIHKIEADLDHYRFENDAYDLIVNCNYLDRRMYDQIEEALKVEGILIFETFLDASGEGFHQPSNPDFVLQENELPEVFAALEQLHYDERDDVNLRGERVRVATFVGRKKHA
jgi:SAM-dependent methyltransferase